MERWLGRWLWVALVAGTSVGAAGWLAPANDGHDLAALNAAGEVTVFSGPGLPLARRAFGPGVLGLAASPRSTVVAVLRRADKGAAVIDCWDYRGDRVMAAPAAAGTGSVALAIAADGRSLFVVQPEAQVVREVGEFLTPERELAAPRLSAAGPGVACQTSPQGLYLAVANAEALWLGTTRARELQRYDLALSAATPPTVRFTRDARWVVVGGDAAVVVVPSIGGLPRRVPLGALRAGAAFDVSSDGRQLFLATGNRLLVLDLSTGRQRANHLVRTDAANAVDAVVCALSGTVAVAYDDGRVAWFNPTRQAAAAFYPPIGTSLPPIAPPTPPTPPTPIPPKPKPNPDPPTPPVPPTAPAKLNLVKLGAPALAEGKFFAGDKDLALTILDKHLARLKDLEQTAVKEGWRNLVLALLALWCDRPDDVPGAFREALPRLAVVDFVELKSVHPVAALQPAMLEAQLGKGAPTGTERMDADGKTWPVYRYGPFGLALEAAADRFPRGTTLLLRPDWAALAAKP